MEPKQALQGGPQLAKRLQQAEGDASAGGGLLSNLADLESMKQEAFQAGGPARVEDQHRPLHRRRGGGEPHARHRA